MNKRLKIIGILFGLIYIGILGFSLSSKLGEFSDGFMDGFNSVKTNPKKKIEKLYEIVSFDVHPKGERYGAELQNIKNGEMLKTKISSFTVKIPPQKITTTKLLTDIFSGILSFAMLFIVIAIPILLAIIIISIIRNDVFNLHNLNRLKWIGYLLVALFGIMLFFYVREYFTAKNLIDLQNYRIIFTMGESSLYLIMGVATLLFAEILKISTQMKEENELTI